MKRVRTTKGRNKNKEAKTERRRYKERKKKQRKKETKKERGVKIEISSNNSGQNRKYSI